MTDLGTSGAATSTGEWSRPRAVLPALCAAQITIWGVVYYAFPAILAGMVRGNLTLLQATAITDRWGTTHYGRLSALLAAPVTIAGALAPFAGAALTAPLGGYPHLFLALAGVSVAAACLAVGTAPRPGE